MESKLLEDKEEQRNLIAEYSSPKDPPQTAISQALTSTAHLANLLPTGTVLALQFLTPIFSKNGNCDGITNYLTKMLLFLLGSSCFIACFTDSFKSRTGRIHYGLATFKGMWLFDFPANSEEHLPDLTNYRIQFVDFVHSALSVLVFFVIALQDRNTVNCFFPNPDPGVQEVLNIVPIGVGVICSLLFVVFPTRRHGIGYPITASKP